MMQIPDHAFTHGGRFHADDVFSTALLRFCNPRIQVQRGFAVPAHFDGIVFDIGGGPYDHHEKNSPVRPNGVPYAAFGLLWRELGADLIGEAEAQRFDKHFVSPLDADDNTGCGNQIAGLIAAFNPAWDCDKSADACFAEAVEVATLLLTKKLETIRAITRAGTVVDAAIEKMQDGIVRLDRFVPWKQQCIPNPDAVFVVYPSQRGGWGAQGVPRRFDKPDLKVPFPAHWAGLADAELENASGIEGLRFCHSGRFLVTGTTEEAVTAACRAALEAAAE